MGWKNWPYWLKGGIFGIVLAVFFFVFQGIAGLNCMGSIDSPNIICKILKLWNYEFFRLLVQPVTLIIAGVIIGWIYGKIKNR